MSAGNLRVEIEAAPELSLAMVENSVPLVARISLTNNGPAAIENLVVEAALLPDYSAKWTTHVSAIPPGGTFNVDDIELPLDRDKLVNQLERGAADLMLWVRHPDEPAPIATTSRRVDVLAYNEWSRTSVPQLLAAFVLPNHPVVAQLLADARDPLAKLTGSPALDGYQSGDPRRIAAIAQAIYEAIQRRGITYSNPPASFERTGQKVRTPEQIATEHVATCLDVSALAAAALEQVGLHPLIVLIEGHAFPGVWLENYFVPEGYIDDGATLRKLVELGRVLIFDSSTTVRQPPVPIAEAKRIAMRALETTQFRDAVDITGARRQHFRPLPIRVAGGYAAAIEVPVAAPQSGPSAIPRTAPAGGSGRSQSTKTKHPRIEAWKQKLLDTSLRNRLLNFKDTAKSLDLLCAEIGAIEDAIASGEELKVRSRPSILGGDDPRSKKLLEARVADDAWKGFVRERLEHRELYADHTSEQTTSKLTSIYRAAREALEETGTNTLCLALGMLHWYESDTSEQPRRAPILLVPVTLERNARTTGFSLRSSNEDTRLNVTLFEKLRLDTGITLDELSELPLDDAGVDVPAVLNIVRNAIINLKRWEVKEELHLGLFSFAKFQMWADLEQNTDALLQNPVVTHLLNGKGEPYPNNGSFPDPAELDAKLEPKDLLCPLDADASQLAAVAAAAEGKTFVLQGPPGTGKSQTITNLITHCIAQGKRVLFVAEKAAALDVVQRRLSQVGLAPYVLELHSHKAGKQQVLDQFREAVDTQPVHEPPTWEADTRHLAEHRKQLNTYVAALHKRRGDLTPFQAIGQLGSLRDAPLVDLPAASAESRERFDALSREVETLRDAIVSLGPPARTPWAGCRIAGWQVDLPSRVTIAIDRAQQAVANLQQTGAELSARLGAGTPASIADVESLAEVATTLSHAPPHGEALDQPSEWSKVEPEARELVRLVRTRADVLSTLRDRYESTLFSLDLDTLAQRFRKLATAFFLFAWWGLRSAKKALLPAVRGGHLPARQQIATDLEQAREVRDIERRLVADDTRGRALYGTSWRATDTDPAALEAALGWASQLKASVANIRPGLLGARLVSPPDLAQLSSSARSAASATHSVLAELYKLIGVDARAVGDELEPIRHRLESWRTGIPLLRSWCAYLASSATLSAAGCMDLVNAATSGRVAPASLSAAFRRGVHEAWLRQVLAAEPALSAFDGEHQHKRIAEFADLDRAYLATAGSVARAAVAVRAPHPSTGGTSGEMGTLQTVLRQKRPRKSIRKLLAEIPSVAARLKPCFLMSPMSVATYLDPHAPPFDIVVFDEASQIPTHDAIGVLARGRSAIIVGDSKQLPPTSFFQSGEGDDTGTEPEFEELESVLDQCIAGGLPERRLDWHYRSRHESLIAFSNFHYYKNRLNTFPSAAGAGAGRGVTLRTVSGFYDKGASATNRAEAEAVVADLLARLKMPDARQRTYGVVTFSMAQQELVEDLLDRARSDNPEIESFFDKNTNTEPVIVKNLENIQGDERDVMIFSICYGPDQAGKLSMNFGPLNREGGERRLNVAVTRAREELVVYSTLAPEQIDLTRTNAVGVKHLKTFLDYARRGPAAIVEAITLQNADRFDSPFEEQVCERLRGLGYTVHTQVGCAGYRLDMAICHPDEPGRYVLAIECDGAHYHSARSARERDRLRAQVLGGLGWRIHRIWSTDWWQMPDREVEKVKVAFTRALVETSRPLQVAPSPPVATPTPVAVDSSSSPASASWTRDRSAPRPQAARKPDSGPALVARGPASDLVPYQIARVPDAKRAADDVHDDRHRDELRTLLHEVIAIESPVSVRVLARRIAPYFDIQRTSSRLEERLRSVLGRSVKIQNEIVWRLDQDPAAFGIARVAPAEARRDAPEVPLEEVANAAASVLRGAIAVDHDELVKLTARALGFGRTGERVAEHMSAGLALLVKRGGARRDGDKVVLL